MAGAYERREGAYERREGAADAAWPRSVPNLAGSYDLRRSRDSEGGQDLRRSREPEGYASAPPWPAWSSSGERLGESQVRLSEPSRLRSPMQTQQAEPWERDQLGEPHPPSRLRSPMRGGQADLRAWDQPGLGERSRLRSPMRAAPAEPWDWEQPGFSEYARPRSPVRGALPAVEAASASHWSRSEHLDRSVDAGLGQAQRAFSNVQTELLIQSRRQDEMFECVGRVEGDLSRVAKLAVENEELHATDRKQKHEAMGSLTRRTEEALLTCESLRKGQEKLIQKIERLEAQAEDRERVSQETRSLQREVDSLQGTVKDKLDTFGHALRRLDAMEQIFDENTKLRQEVAQLRRANERRDLEMAAVQGQIDALTKLVREQLREPLSPHKGLVNSPETF